MQNLMVQDAVCLLNDQLFNPQNYYKHKINHILQIIERLVIIIKQIFFIK